MVRGEIGLDIVHSIKLLLNQHIEVKIKQITPAYTIVQKTIKLLYNRKDRVRTVKPISPLTIDSNGCVHSEYVFDPYIPVYSGFYCTVADKMDN
jgi:hypothetical protein